MSFVHPASDSYFTSVGPRYNGTRLYLYNYGNIIIWIPNSDDLSHKETCNLGFGLDKLFMKLKVIIPMSSCCILIHACFIFLQLNLDVSYWEKNTTNVICITEIQSGTIKR